MTTNVKVESKTVFGGNDCQSSSMSGAEAVDVMDVVDVVAASVEANDYIGSRVVSGKERLFCKWTDCRYESNQKNCISRHILNKHLNPNKANPFDSYDETKYWEKILNSTKSLLKRSHPKTTPEKKPVAPPEAEAEVEESLPEPPVLTPFDSEMTSDGIDETFFDDSQWLDQMSMDSLQAMIPQKGVSVWDNNDGVNVGLDESDVQKDHLNISNNEENVLLSCKGLASMSKVRQYYESQVLNGEKYFLCKWKRCEFKTKKSQKIAQHINLSHIGVEFKCNKPNCNKVFKNPNTYREHQKNHICGFGIFGYGSKGVIGVCRNENLNRYRERVIIDSKKFYRCKWDNCNAITRYHMAMKRHLHGHVCPYRVNLKLKQNQQVISDMKSDNWNLDLGLGSIASTSGALVSSSPEQSCDTNSATKKTYQCRRNKCMASFDSNADLVQHENNFCKFITKTKQMMTYNSNDELNAKRFKANEQMDGNESTSQQTNGNSMQNTSIANLEMMANIDKYVNKKVMNGISYNLCVFGNCKYTSKQLHKTVDHIQRQHFGPQLNDESQRVDDSMTESPETESFKENTSKKSKTVEILVNNVNPSEVVVSARSAPTVSAMSSGRSGQQKYAKHTVDGQTRLFCTHDGCEFFTKIMSEMETHANEAHNQLFVCDISNCEKQFRTTIALSQHKLNHICGFNIKGRRPTGVCDLDNIRQYREGVTIDNRMVYPCRWCIDVIFENRSVALAHIHNKHICPNRLSINGSQSSTFSRNVQRIGETKKKSNQNHQNVNIDAIDNSLEGI